jgi:hypothetical protein
VETAISSIHEFQRQFHLGDTLHAKQMAVDRETPIASLLNALNPGDLEAAGFTFCNLLFLEKRDSLIGVEFIGSQ